MINNNNNINAKESFKVNHIIFYALLTGLIIFVLLAYFLIAKEIEPIDASIARIFMFIVPVFVVIEIFLSRFMYNKVTKQIESNATLFDKLGKYRTAKIISWALLEGTGLFSVIVFMITGSNFFLIMFLVVIGAFIVSKPSIEEFLNDFNVEGAERNEFI